MTVLPKRRFRQFDN